LAHFGGKQHTILKERNKSSRISKGEIKMASYRPGTATLLSADAISGTVVSRDITASTWGLFLLKGTALDVSGSPLASGAVQVWESTAATTGPATRMTFSDDEGIYGITCRAGIAITVKFYDN
jgi:hypothetical protein